MNSIFQAHLRKFVLVLFDDILVYSPSWDSHLQHIRTILRTLGEHQLFLKRSKCSFAQTTVAYLGHIVSQEGVMVDNAKIQAVTSWPQPTNPTALRGFLGLTGYYRKFVKNYGVIAAPLTKLLRKHAFQWTSDATVAFEELKTALTTTPVLALPDFKRQFIIECDASDMGIGAVLQQEGRPISFYSHTLALRYQKLPAYEKVLIGLIKAVRHWNSYFWGQYFIVRTDHYSLKYLLEQRIATPSQQRWVCKLLGYNFGIEYKPGHSNIVADALSRRIETAACHAISCRHWDLLAEIRTEQHGSEEVQLLINKVQESASSQSWDVQDGLLLYKGRIFLPKLSPLIDRIISSIHNSCHEGYQKTLYRLNREFFWPGMRRNVLDFITSQVCQRTKIEQLQPAGLLQPRPIPRHIGQISQWISSRDFLHRTEKMLFLW